jgi:hypothetical protein
MIRLIFVVAAACDGLLGLVFLLAPSPVFAAFGVTPPNHWGYVQFPAAVLVVFALMFVAVARQPRANRNLIPYGILLKVAYSGVVFGWWIASGLPGMWKPFAVIDVIFAALFFRAYRSLGSGE